MKIFINLKKFSFFVIYNIDLSNISCSPIPTIKPETFDCVYCLKKMELNINKMSEYEFNDMDEDYNGLVCVVICNRRANRVAGGSWYSRLHVINTKS